MIRWFVRHTRSKDNQFLFESLPKRERGQVLISPLIGMRLSAPRWIGPHADKRLLGLGCPRGPLHRVKYRTAATINANTTNAPRKSNNRIAVLASPFPNAGLFKRMSRAAKNAIDIPTAWAERIAAKACGEPRALIGPSRPSKAAVKKPPTRTRSLP
jgi:hypothetical protein